MLRFGTIPTVRRKLGSWYNDDRDFVSETMKIIMKNTEISTDHLTPEIRLRLLTPNCTLYHKPLPLLTDTMRDSEDSMLAKTFREPFWSIYWPGGQVLTRFLLDYGQELFSNQYSKVLDIGCGSGASAIAAKLRGAYDVVANDIESVACVAVEMNAALNKVRLNDITNDNLIAKEYKDAVKEDLDFILVGDLLYDDEVSEILEPWLDQAAMKGARIFLGDPGRHGVTDKLRRKLRVVRTYDLPENVKRENNGFQTATVYEFFNNKKVRKNSSRLTRM